MSISSFQYQNDSFFLLNVKLKQEMSKHSVRHFCYFITWSVIAR